jgi:hypothetical protein
MMFQNSSWPQSSAGFMTFPNIQARYAKLFQPLAFGYQHLNFSHFQLVEFSQV